MGVVDLFGSRRASNAVAYSGAPGFEAAWKLYPRREAKAEALRAWQRLSERDREAALAALPAHIEHWARRGVEPEHVPHLRRWLHGRRWEDELPGTQVDDARRVERLLAHAERRR